MGKTSPARKARLRTRHEAQAAEERLKCAALRAQGNQCSNCQHKGWRGAGELVCELDSDFYGHCRVKPDNVCGRYENQHGTTP